MRLGWLRGRRRRFALAGAAAAIAVAVGLVVVFGGGDDGERWRAPEAARAPSSSSRARTAGAPLAADAPVAGWILDDTGAPLAGARVSLGGTAVTTAADGSFRLAAPAPGEHTLAIDGPGVHPSEVRWRSDAPPARILVARGIEVIGRVTRGGRPAAGIAVALRDGSGPARASAQSDAAGLVRFTGLPQGRYELSAHGPGESSRLVQARSGTSDIALAPATDVRGRVRTDDGSGARATVTLVPTAGDLATRTAETDAAGAFAIDGVPAGRWEVDLDAPGHVPAAAYVLDASGARAELDLRVRRGGAVAGRVIDPAGAPVAGATLVLRRQGGDATPMRAAAPTAPGRIRWVHPLAGPRQMPFRDSRRFGAARDGARPAECGRGHCGVDLGGIRGSTVHAAADGIALAVVTEIRPRAGRFVLIEHAGGLRTFYMHLDDVRGDLVAGQTVRAGEPIGTLGRTGVIKSGPHLHFALAQEDGGRTWYIDPEPMLQQAIVLAEAAEAPGALAGALIAHARGESSAAGAAARPLGPSLLVTDSGGRFRIEGLAPGRYVATAFHGDLAPGASDPFEVASGHAAAIHIQLAAGVVVFGRVLGPRGPVAGARISAEEGIGESVHSVGKAYTDAAGRFELRPLAGSIDLTVSAGGFGSAERHLELAARGIATPRREEDFELAAQDAAIAGQVVDPMGFPVRGATVRIASGAVRGRRAVSDGSGRFLLPALPSGRYQIEVVSGTHPPAQAEARTDDPVRIALVAGGAIRLAVLDRQTRSGVAGARIAATGPGGARAAAVTDAGGRAELRALATGRWRVRAAAPGFSGAERGVELAAGGGEATLELSRGAVLAGVVRDRNGDRVAGARVSAGDAATTTDQNGRFRLTDVPTGRVVIECESEERRGEQPLQLAPGDEIVTLELRL